jgi:hypothetical protein
MRYRGLKKNHDWLCAAFALINVYQNRKRGSVPASGSKQPRAREKQPINHRNKPILNR